MAQTRAFRAGLRDELPKWTDEGLVTPEVAERLHDRYRLDEDGGSYAALAIYLLGTLLIGGGVISFVAWNWAYLPDTAKMTGGLGLMLACQLSGYFLWRIDGRRPWLGQGLVFLGLVLFGANLGLFAQIYGVHDHWRHGLGAWALAAVTLAFATRSLPCAVAAAALAIGWGVGELESHPPYDWALAYALPAIIAAVGFYFRSGLVVAIAFLGAAVLLVPVATWNTHPTFYVPLAVAVAMLGVSLFGDWPSTPLRRLGVGGFTLLAYSASFEAVARRLRLDSVSADSLFGLGLATLPALIGGIVALALRFRQRTLWRPAEQTTVVALVGALVILAGAAAGKEGIWLAAHAALVGLVTVSIRRALQELERGPFWFGVVLGGLVILTRFLEFETGLLAKAGVFTLSGIAVIAVGYAFELRRREVIHAQ